MSGFCRRPGFDSQHPHGDSQLAVTSVPRDLMPFSDLEQQANAWCKYICRQNTKILKIFLKCWEE